LRLDNVDFCEEDHQEDADQSSILQRKVFRYKYRQAISTPEEHQRREQRLLERMVHPRELIKAHQQMENATESDKDLYEQKYYEALIDSQVENYRNYFESDLEEDFHLFEQLPHSAKFMFLETL